MTQPVTTNTTMLFNTNPSTVLHDAYQADRQRIDQAVEHAVRYTLATMTPSAIRQLTAWNQDDKLCNSRSQ